MTDDVLEYLRSDEFFLPTRFVLLIFVYDIIINIKICSANEIMNKIRQKKDDSDDEDPVRVFMMDYNYFR